MQATETISENRTEAANKQLIQTKSFRSKKETHTITAVMEKYTLVNGMTTLL